MSEFDDNDDWHLKNGFLPPLNFRFKESNSSSLDELKNLKWVPTSESSAETTGKKYSSGASGKKYDDCKLKMGMVLSYFADAFEGVAACGTYGNKKYADGYWDYNWNNLTDAEMRYMDAGMRHLLEHMKGNLIDEESGLPHIDHAIWNFMAVSQLIKERKE